MARICPYVALLTANEMQAQALEKLLQRYVTLIHVRSLRELLDEPLGARQFDALFCDWSDRNGVWKDAVETVREQHPDLPVILLSGSGSESEWLEVVEVGAFDLLVPPYEESYVLSLIEHAAASRLARQWHSLPVTPLAAA